MTHEITGGLDAGHGRTSGGSGRLLPGATLHTRDGDAISLDSYRPRWDLVVVMLGDDWPPAPRVEQLLHTLANARTAIAAEEGKVIAIAAIDRAKVPREPVWPFPVLFDDDGMLHAAVGALDATGRPTPAFYITDRYREMFVGLRPEDTDWPVDSDVVIKWLQFINIQCPECGAPE